MGKTSADVEREIEEIRRETSWIVEELEYRVRRAMDLRAQAEAHPYITGGTAVALAGGLAFLVYRLIESGREAAEPAVQLRQRVTAARRELRERVPEVFERRRPDMLKRVLWAMFAAGMLAMAGFLTRRLSESLWTTTMKEPPPERLP